MTDAELVIIGNGMACQRLLAELVQLPTRPQRIVVFGAEAKPAYNRVLLSSLLSNELPDSSAELASAAWYAEHGIELICDDAVLLIDRERQVVVSTHGRYRRYQQLVLACGAQPLTPAYAHASAGVGAAGADVKSTAPLLQPGICHFRNWQDLTTLRQASQQLQHVVVVGGGFLGLEAAEGLRKLGMQVSLLQRGAYLLNRQLDATAAGLLQQQLSTRGLTILTHSEIATVNYAQGQLCSVQLTTGQQLKADLLVLALGISPNTALAQQAGLEVKRGILVNPQLQSSDSAIYALGECIELNGETFGLVAPINAQAAQLARTLCGEKAQYCSEPAATQLKISGIALSSCGDIASLCANPSQFDACTAYLDAELNEYRHLWWRGPYLVGAVLYGDTSLSQRLSQLIMQQQPYHGCRSSLLLGASLPECISTADSTNTTAITAKATLPQSRATFDQSQHLESAPC